MKANQHKSKKRAATLASRADRHALYQNSVQDTEAELDFVDEVFVDLNGRRPHILREDFCGTGNTACAWVQRHRRHIAIGVDNDAEVLDWGRTHNLHALAPAQQQRVRLLQADVMLPPAQAVDVVLAMNFSYYLFKTRAELGRYFRRVRQSLQPDGVFFMDAYGGYEAHSEIEENRECFDAQIGKFTYLWDQHRFNPINHHMNCQIHFAFPDGSRMDKAFNYDWRLWCLPELQELLAEAGFSRVHVYWEGTDEDTNEGDGVYTVQTEGEADAGWICYLVAQL